MIPDNESILDSYEREQNRLDRRYRREEIKEEIEFEEVPDDYGTHEECYPNYKEDL